ncbi:hypothetical protein D3C73_721190 [compost metagenome]
MGFHSRILLLQPAVNFFFFIKCMIYDTLNELVFVFRLFEGNFGLFGQKLDKLMNRIIIFPRKIIGDYDATNQTNDQADQS